MIATVTVNGKTVELSGNHVEVCSAIRELLCGKPPLAITYGTPIHLTGTTCYVKGCETCGIPKPVTPFDVGKWIDDLYEFADNNPAENDIACNLFDYVRAGFEADSTIIFRRNGGERIAVHPDYNVGSGKFVTFPRKKVCDPLARHYGNCGAADCPIICAHTDRTWEGLPECREFVKRFYCNTCRKMIYL